LAEPLQYFIPFLLYRVMAKGIKRASGDYAKLKLTIQEARVLIVLAQHRTMRVGALADLTAIEQSALSHMLRELSRRNLVKRDRVQHDNRAVDVSLSSEGMKLARVCLDISRKHEEVMLKDFSVGNQRTIRVLLNKIYENVADWNDGGALAIAQRQRKQSGKQNRRPSIGMLHMTAHPRRR